MYGNLDIPDVEFQNAVQLIGQSVSTNFPDVRQSDSTILGVLKSYVKLGVAKQIDDWGTTINLRDAVATEIQNDMKPLFSFSAGPSLNTIEVDLDALITLGAIGRVSQYIAFPVKWQTQMESALAASSADTAAQHPGGLLGDIESGIGSAIGGTIKSIFSEIGLPLAVVIVLLLALVIYLKFK